MHKMSSACIPQSPLGKFKVTACCYCRIRYVNSVASPTFYQYATDVVFRQLIQEQFPLPKRSAEQSDPSAVISYQESNVLRYVSGYVCHALTARVKSSNHPQKKELLLCLGDLTTDEQDEQLSNTEDWTKLIDLGGLTHVNPCE